MRKAQESQKDTVTEANRKRQEWNDKYFPAKAMTAYNKRAKWYRLALLFTSIGGLSILLTHWFKPIWLSLTFLTLFADLYCFIFIAIYTTKYIYYYAKKM